MKLSLDLKYKTPPEWTAAVLEDFDSFLHICLSHKGCINRLVILAGNFGHFAGNQVDIRHGLGGENDKYRIYIIILERS